MVITDNGDNGEITNIDNYGNDDNSAEHDDGNTGSSDNSTYEHDGGDEDKNGNADSSVTTDYIYTYCK